MGRPTSCCAAALLGAALFAAPAFAQSSTSDEAPGAALVSRDSLMATDRWLASHELGGRLAGSPGYLAAAHCMADRFRALGLSPAGEDGYFQRLDVELNEIRSARLDLVDSRGARRALRLGADFTCRGLTGSGEITAPVVFAGYGLSWPERGYDDYAGLDARGKIVLALKEPPPFQVDSAGWGSRPLPRPKARAAAAHGALALLVVSAPDQEHPQAPIGSMLEGPGPEDARFPTMQVSDAVAETLVSAAGAHLAALQTAIDSTRAPRPLALPGRAHVAVRARYRERAGSVNVVARLEGSDPALRGQCVVVGAHLDHVGTQDTLWFPGANDNASGASAVLEIARAFANSGARPRRTVIFALFSSEEAGLNGSKRFVAHPPVPAESLVAYVNLDCVAHGDSIQVGGGKTWKRFWSLVRDLDARDSRRTIAATWPGGGADAQPFAERGIPIAYFASNPSYTHLHLPSDTPETLNPELFEALTRLAYRAAWAVAQGAEVKE